MRKSTALEEWKGVDIADGKIMAQVEIGTGAIGRYVIGINKRVVAPRGSIVDGVTVSVGDAHRKVAHSALRPDLQGVIDRISSVPKGVDVVVSTERSAYRGIAGNRPASNGEIECHLPRDWIAIHRATGQARVRTHRIHGQTCVVRVSRGNDWFALPVRICRRRHWEKLVGVVE